MKFATKTVRRVLLPIAVAGGLAVAGATGASAAVYPVICYPDGSYVLYDDVSGNYALIMPR
ncbi:hypothetical protein [Jiangella gansuensis]|uniref:hypothetical protein n=1 Tax=Jiangella gansuensis TaxID=281473 RepID=UPI00047BDB86|nr:hypothetical protein [Jiangella gansuensis]